MGIRKRSRDSISNHKMFPISKPWGYYPAAVESKINEYESTLRVIDQKVNQERQKNARLNARLKQELEEKNNLIASLQEELREMHMQMSNLDLPEADEVIEHVVLDNFKNYNRGDSDVEIKSDRHFESKPLDKQIKTKDGGAFHIVQ